MKLDPCKHCGGQATIWYARGEDTVFAQCDQCQIRTNGYSSDEQAAAAWNRTPPARKLTLDELRGMDGQPVYIVEHPGWGHWELSEDAEDYLQDRDVDFYGMEHNDPCGRYGLHVLGWVAYDKEPEGGCE